MKYLLKCTCLDFFKIIAFFLLICESAWSLSFVPFMQSFPLEIQKSRGIFICSSVAISPQVILTAAHCVEGAKEIVLVKGHSLERSHKRYEAYDWKPHPKYNSLVSKYHFDIARIILKKPLPRELPFANIGKSRQDGLMVRVGFGAREGVSKRTLIYGQEVLYHDEVYLEFDDNYGVMGDSGGPIFQFQEGRYVLVGIHSTKQGDHITYAVYTEAMTPFVEYL